MEEGRLAGICAAESLGLMASDVAEREIRETRHRLNVLRSGMFGETRRKNKDEQILAMKKYRRMEAEHQ